MRIHTCTARTAREASVFRAQPRGGGRVGDRVSSKGRMVRGYRMSLGASTSSRRHGRTHRKPVLDEEDVGSFVIAIFFPLFLFLFLFLPLLSLYCCYYDSSLLLQV